MKLITYISLSLLCISAAVDGKTVNIAWKVPMDPSSIKVPSGDSIKFTWSNTHNVYQMKNKEYYDACNFTDAVHVGEGQHSHRGRRTSSSSETSATAVMGSETMYFSCTVGSHCKSKQKLEVSVDTVDTGIGSHLYVRYLFSVGAVMATTLALL